jgi:transcriptional regulator with XRE-family HTH domain
MDSELKDRIRTRRESLKLTQADIAERLKLSRLTYIAIESGDKVPTIDQVEAISAILGISSLELLFPDLDMQDGQQSAAKYRQMCLACIQFGGSEADGKITKTKLAKLLYLVDFSWYVLNGKSMSNFTYRALPRGPVAEQFFQMTDDMFESGQVQIEAKGAALLFSVTEQSTQPLLGSDELAHIRTVAEKWRVSDTQTIVDFTHNQSPWMMTQPGATISYELARKIPVDQLY